MNKIKSFLSVIGLAFILLMTIFVVRPGPVNAAEECRIVKISGVGSPMSIRVEPETLSVSQGTCVVWVNWTRATEVRVKFKEGKKCADATKAPVGFRMDAMNCLVTDHIPLGATSSLMFTEVGTFDYEVEAASANLQRGRITVK